jgi:hypothetical protein
VKALPVVFLTLSIPLLAAQSDSPSPPEPGQLPQPDNMEKINNTVTARHLSVREKFDYRVLQSFGYRGIVGAAMAAAIGQARDDPREWGEGAAGLGQRFGWAVVGNVTRQSMAFGLETAFHEDPRYFPSESSSKKERLLNAIKQAYICKTDSGQSQFGWARVISDFGAGQVDNLWQPPSSRGFGHGIERAFISLGADTGFNIAQEFLPFLRSKTFSKP